jgi:GWxTD domain-containing protein
LNLSGFSSKRTDTLKTVGALLLLFIFPISSAFPLFAQEEEKKKTNRSDTLVQEEIEDYYEKWLKEDVVYIITAEEKAIFNSLTTPEEKEQFIEQFWFRRDPDPKTAFNEYKEEHYRRIAYANEMFASGIRGWQTDRGKIYIIHGPPDEIQSRPVGGSYHRPTEEGGGSTQTFPFITWRYRYIEGIGSNIVIEFVDRTQSGEYRIALMPEEKDALLHVPGAGLTLEEEFFGVDKSERLVFSPWNRFRPRPFAFYQDPFERYERYVNIRKQPEIKYNDLKSIVDVDITYDVLPVQVQHNYLRLNEFQVLVPVTIQLNNKDLMYKTETGRKAATVAIYGAVSNLSNRLIDEFDDDIGISFDPGEFETNLLGQSVYQKILPLDQKQRYKLTLVVKDTQSGKVGVETRAIVPPRYESQDLLASSLFLTDNMYQLENLPDEEQMFVLGDFYVRPNLQKTFTRDEILNTYLQVYNAAFDQTTLEPSLSLKYRIIHEGKTINEYNDETGTSVQYFSGQRIVIAAGFPINALEPGRYQLTVDVLDEVSQKTLQLSEQFIIQ